MFADDSNRLEVDAFICMRSHPLPLARRPGSIRAGESHTDQRHAGRSQYRSGPALFRNNVVFAHPLPATTEGVAMKQCEAGARGHGLTYGAFEILRIEARVAMHLAIPWLRQDQICDQRRCSRFSKTRMPKGKAQVFLSIASEQMPGHGLLNVCRQRC